MTEMKPLKCESESTYELCMRALVCIDDSRAGLAEFKTKLSRMRELQGATEEQRPPSQAKRDSPAEKNNRRRQQ
jgi:hypothetical protein